MPRTCPKPSAASACPKQRAVAKIALLAPFLILIACSTVAPRPAPDGALELPISECGWAYFCFDECEGDRTCAVECRAAYPDVADQAGEARYQATRFGDSAAQLVCFFGAAE